MFNILAFELCFQQVYTLHSRLEKNTCNPPTLPPSIPDSSPAIHACPHLLTSHTELCVKLTGEWGERPFHDPAHFISLFIQIPSVSLDCGTQARMLWDILISEIFSCSWRPNPEPQASTLLLA